MLVLTGRDDEAAVRRAFEVGANDFATKGSVPALIIHRLRFLQRAQAARAELRRSEARLAEAQRIARVGNWELDPRSGAFLGSAETFRLLGLGHEAGIVPLSRVRALVSGVDASALDAMIEGAMRQPCGRFEQELRLLGPEALVLQVRGETLGGDGAPVRMLGTMQDITDAVRARKQIETLAYFDALTGLPNRVHFVEQVRGALAQARRRGRRVALMIIDLDNFKRINDTLGHGAGDEVLRVVGRRLHEAVRQYDAIGREPDERTESSLARMGGDEFLLSAVDLESGEQAATVARRILDAVEAPIALHTGEYTVSASIGISVFPEDGDTFESLLKHADVALYQAKDAGRNAYEFYDRRMSEAALHRLVLESSLRSAIAARELGMAIQPKVDGRTGALLGGEALLRWRHEHHGVVVPSVFVPLAERVGLASPLTLFIVEEVARQLAAWRDAALPLVPIAVNLSAHVFRDPAAIEAILATPALHGIAPSLIDFEVTETALIDDPQRAEAVLKAMRAHGYHVALDDFGTGFSSLSHLRRFQLDAIKVDRSFVRDLQENPRDASIVEAIIALARSLGVEAVAEGVENEAQRERLLRFGCTTMQGYLFGKPEPAAEFALRLAATGATPGMVAAAPDTPLGVRSLVATPTPLRLRAIADA
ncbi:MAG: EAL domain-containing protein [Gemmatimonadaceae bacterium]|nr:EAL domain-containing protein [Gemmatimonadaceae bacterium]